jgi:glycosyltransferase involved in cell wall biosynthesis
MKISIITVCLNSGKNIHDSIESVISQVYKNIEYIIIDGQSNDNTINVIKSFGSKIDTFRSEPDNGLYDAMNRGVSLATGDVIGFLNSDDVLFDKNIVKTIADTFGNYNVDCVFGDLVFVKPENTKKIVRYYSSKKFKPSKFKFGYMPAHPTFYCKKEIYEKFGVFETDYQIAADYELLLRFLKVHKIKYKYIPKIFVKMRTGGISTKSIKSNWVLNLEILRACKRNNLDTTLVNIYLKYFGKIFEFIKRPGFGGWKNK